MADERTRKRTGQGAGPEAPPKAGVRSGSRLRAWVDGGARGNPGPAGFGVAIKTLDGELVKELGGYLGRATNNVAEYSGLIAALEAAHELGAEELEVFSDSELMVRQMNGQYKVRNEGLKPLFAKAKALAGRLGSVRISHVRREENREADRLANEAMDRGAPGPV